MRTRTDHIIVRCAARKHRVRLAAGRFWSTAQCGSCHTPVDPTRLRRIGRWLARLGAPATAAARHQTLWWMVGAYLVGMVIAAGLLWQYSDRLWPATTLLFGPRWLLALPLLGLVPLALAWDRPLILPLAAAAAVVAGPIMGMQIGWRRLFSTPDAVQDLRFVTFNAMGGRTLVVTPSQLLLEWNADVVALQECGELAGVLRQHPVLHVNVLETLCLVSRFPITNVAQMDRQALKWAGGAGLVVTYTLDVDGTPVHVTNVHLETPRAGFERIRAGQILSGASKLREKSALREIELRRARRWVDEFQGPHVVLGDFNTPSESTIYRAAWADWTNAFLHAGRGFGGTRLNGWIRARIDHIVVNGDWQVVLARVGRDAGSDHLPVIALLRPRSN